MENNTMGYPPQPPDQPYGQPQQPYQPPPPPYPGQQYPQQGPSQGQYPQQGPHQGQQYPPQAPYQGQPYPQQPPGPRKSVIKQRGLSGKSHMFHLVLTICTCSLWGWFVWLPLWIYRMIVRRKEVTRHHY